VLVEGGANLLDVGAVDANGFVELVAGDSELFGPVGDVGGHLGVDLFRIVGSFGVFDGFCGCDDVVSHALAPLSTFSLRR